MSERSGSSGGPPRAVPASYALLALGCGAALVAIYAVDYLPTNDGPQNAYAAFARARLGQPSFAHFYAPTWPWSAWGWNLVFATFDAVLGYREGLRAAVAVAALAWVTGIWSIARALPSWRLALGLVGAAGALQWALYMGFFNWLLGAGLGLLAIGLATVSDVGVLSKWRWFAIAAVLGAASAAHPFGGQLGGAGLVLLSLSQLGRAEWPRRAVLLAAVGVVPIASTLGSVIGVSEITSHASYYAIEEYYPPISERLWGLIVFYLPGPWYRGVGALSLGLLGLGFGLAGLRRLSPTERALVALAALYLALALLTPRHAKGWQNFSPRFVPVALSVGALLIPLERVRWPHVRTVASSALVLWFGASTMWAVDYHRRLGTSSERWLAALDAPHERGRTLLPIVVDASLEPSVPRRDFEVPYARPHVNTGLVYAMAREAVSPYTFSASPSFHVILDRERFPRVPSIPQDVLHLVPDPAIRLAEAHRLASYGARFDETLFIGPEDFVEVFETRGFERIHRGPNLFLGRFVGCPTSLAISGDRGPDTTLTIVTGWDPAYRAVELVEDLKPESWPLVRAMERAPCGRIWLRVISSDGARCRGATNEGDIFVNGGGRVECELLSRR
jgi:hypothetical protein